MSNEFRFLCCHSKYVDDFGRPINVKDIFYSRGWSDVDLRPYTNPHNIIDHPRMNENNTVEVWVKGYHWPDQLKLINEKYTKLLDIIKNDKERQEITNEWNMEKQKLQDTKDQFKN